jgi:uncharacterized membrane protein HdeD (DUF308 family)
MGILAGLVIWTGWPASGLWVIGFVIGLDLLFYGVWWVARGLTVMSLRERPALS